MGDDVLAPYVAKPSATMVLSMKDKHLNRPLVSMEKDVNSLCQLRIEN